MRRRTRFMGVALVAVVVATAVACSGDGGGDATTTPPSTRPSSSGSVTIVAPANGDEVTGPTVSVQLELQGAEISPETSTNLVPDKGHIHILLDDRLVDMNYALEGDIPDVEPGTHVLRVQFVALDHGPFDPPVFAEVAFEVTG